MFPEPVTPLPEGSGNITSGIIGLTDTRAHSLVLNYAKVLNRDMVNEFRFGYTRRSIDRQATQLSSSPSDALKIPGIPSNAAFENTLPTFTIAGFQQLGSPTNTASEFRTDVTRGYRCVVATTRPTLTKVWLRLWMGTSRCGQPPVANWSIRI